jgi:hypothetical protein
METISRASSETFLAQLRALALKRETSHQITVDVNTELLKYDHINDYTILEEDLSRAARERYVTWKRVEGTITSWCSQYIGTKLLPTDLTLRSMRRNSSKSYKKSSDIKSKGISWRVRMHTRILKRG